MSKINNSKNSSADQFRVTTLLARDEKTALKKKAWKSGRTMSSYIRYLIVEDCDDGD